MVPIELTVLDVVLGVLRSLLAPNDDTDDATLVYVGVAAVLTD